MNRNTTTLNARRTAAATTAAPEPLPLAWATVAGHALRWSVTRRWPLAPQELWERARGWALPRVTRLHQAVVRRAQRARRKVLVAFPVPAEMKWQETLQLQNSLLQSGLEEMEEALGRQTAQDLMDRMLYVSGKRWICASGPFKTNVEPNVGALAEVLTLAFKSLDIRSNVSVSANGVTVTNTACLFVRWAQTHHMEPERMCQMLCGNQASFFKGVSYSYPIYVSYRATHMMGKGHPACKKTFQVR